MKTSPVILYLVSTNGNVEPADAAVRAVLLSKLGRTTKPSQTQKAPALSAARSVTAGV